jgi:Fe-S-cluster-containing dehydrogenase component/formate-dependent nitrite reductase membrane component NrfD
MNFGFIIDNRKCIGCHACTVACKAEHEVPVGVNRTWVKYIEKGTFPDTRRLFSVMRCNHCADAPCVEICPVTALFTRKDGIVDFDSRRCIGCKSCTQACPYDALYMEPADHTAAKCNYCSHRVDIGLEPACVNVCPEHAIISGDMDNPSSEISKLLARETVSVRKPEKGTMPKLFYIDGDKASLDPTEANPDTEYMWSSQSSGVGHFAGRNADAPVRIERRQTLDNKATQEDFRREAAVRTGASAFRRVYDAPSKGVLWGWEVAAYVWTKAIAAGAFLVPIIGGYFMEIPFQMKQLGAWVSLIFLAITGILLIKDLGRPDRFLYVLLRPQWRSWLTRGAYIITGYGAVLTAWIVVNYFARDELLRFIEPVGIILALLAAVYTAFLFAQAKGRDFWQSPMLGLHMIIHSLMAGLAVFLTAGLWLKANVGLSLVLFFFTTAVLVINLITLAIELTTTHSTEDAHTVVKMITRGQFSYQFWLGMILVGNLVPLLLLMTGQAGSLALAGFLILLGLLIGERIWVRAPQMIPLS